MNQSKRAKKRGLPKRSETAPSAMGMVPVEPPLRADVRRLLAESNRVWNPVFTDFDDSGPGSVAMLRIKEEGRRGSHVGCAVGVGGVEKGD